ncbi:MAG: hypothetical protein PHY47_28585 [Lachnospiraceae bacterium]|nr:hypothetical protein [Lachnospiraceae bacterium]
MGRMTDVAVLACPICGKKPFLHIYGVNTAWIECKGYGMHRHKKVSVCIQHERPSKLLKEIINKWNDLQFDEIRFIYDENGNPFKNNVVGGSEDE